MDAQRPEGTDEDRPPENLTGVVTRGFGYAGLGFALSQGLTLLAYLALARIATPEDFGEFAAAAVVVSVGLMFTESGMLGALIHRKDRIEEAASTATVATVLAGLAFSLLALALAPLVGMLFESSRVAALSAAMAGLLLLRSIQIVPEGLLQRRFSFLRRLVIEPSQAIAFGVFAIYATSNGLGPWGLVIGFYASAVTDAVLSWALVRWRPRLRLASFAMWKEMIGYGRHLVIGNLAHRGFSEVPTVLIGRFLGTAPLGQFRYANRMASTPHALIVNAGAFVLFPALSRIAKEPVRFREAFLSAFGTIGAVAFALGSLLVPFGITAAVLVFGAEWRPAGEAVTALAFGVAIGSTSSLMSEAFKALGRPDITVPSHVVSGVASTIAMVALLPFGLVGVAAGVSIGFMVGAIYMAVRLSRLMEISFRRLMSPLLGPILAALVMCAVFAPLDRLFLQPDTLPLVEGLALLGLEVVGALALYTAVLRIVSPSTVAMARSAAGRALNRAG